LDIEDLFQAAILVLLQRAGPAG